MCIGIHDYSQSVVTDRYLNLNHVADVYICASRLAGSCRSGTTTM